MKVHSVEFVFDNMSSVKYQKGSNELYEGNHPKFIGKNYTYTVVVENKFGRSKMFTFASPSQSNAKGILLQSLKK